MKRGILPSFAFGVLLLAGVLLFVSTSSMRQEAERLATELTHVKDSVAVLLQMVDSLKVHTPGLGEYMSTISLHTAKLWFAGQAANWKLATYELDELEETIEAAEALHARKNDIDISAVLQSVRQTQLPMIQQAIDKKSLRAFEQAYRQTLAACNGCHQTVGYEFIHIITPTREPVTNQQWKVGK